MIKWYAKAQTLDPLSHLIALYPLSYLDVIIIIIYFMIINTHAHTHTKHKTL